MEGKGRSLTPSWPWWRSRRAGLTGGTIGKSARLHNQRATREVHQHSSEKDLRPEASFRLTDEL
jgi:hypothetical protein